MIINLSDQLRATDFVTTQSTPVFNSENLPHHIAIVMDGNVHMAGVIRDKIADGRTQIEGMNDLQDAKKLAVVLRAGKKRET